MVVRGSVRAHQATEAEFAKHVGLFLSNLRANANTTRCRLFESSAMTLERLSVLRKRRKPLLPLLRMPSQRTEAPDYLRMVPSQRSWMLQNLPSLHPWQKPHLGWHLEKISRNKQMQPNHDQKQTLPRKISRMCIRWIASLEAIFSSLYLFWSGNNQSKQRRTLRPTRDMCRPESSLQLPQALISSESYDTSFFC